MPSRSWRWLESTGAEAYAGTINIRLRNLLQFSAVGRVRFIAALALAPLLPISLASNPAHDPRRFINNVPVDLSPLVKWWTNRNGPRPLTAWVHLTGTVVATNSGTWIVAAQVEGTGPNSKNSEQSSEPVQVVQKIVLRNPPLDELIEFQQLTSRLAELNKQRAALGQQESQAKARDQAVTEQQHASHNRVRTRVLAAEDKQLKQLEKQAETQQKPVDDELKDIKTKLATYPKTDQYLVDCFALDLKYVSNAMRVYDHGRTVK